MRVLTATALTQGSPPSPSAMSSLHSTSSSKLSSLPLYRRLLFPDLPPSVSPPPILPHASPELNTELYTFIALALRAYITPWWSKITRYDSDLVPHIACILGDVIRALVSRVDSADVPQLLFRGVPIIVAQHYADYRAAASKIGSAYASGGASTVPQLFHQYQSHMGIDADGNMEPTYIRHLLDLILQETLPAEDQGSEAERTIIREVVAKVLMKDVVPMLCQPWFIHKMILDQLRSGQEVSVTPTAPEASPTRHSSPTFHTALVYILSTVQYVSGLCLTLMFWYKQSLSMVKRVKASPELPKVTTTQRNGFAMSLLKCASEILNAKSRMAASVVFDALETSLKFIESFADRLLMYALHTYVMTEGRAITLVRLSKQTLFPNGYPGPPTIIPSPAEQLLIKEQLILQIQSQVPPFISGLVLGPGSTRRETIADVLEPLSSEACNAHLVLFLLDLLVLALFPELGVQVSSSDDEEDDGRRTASSPELETDLPSATGSSTENGEQGR